jgi:threonine synthase
MVSFNLVCRECGTAYSPEYRYVCENCFAPLEIRYDIEKVGVRKGDFIFREKNIWRYSEFLPISNLGICDNSVGFTPLIRASRLGEKLGLKNLYIKNDTLNPTGSFKDRPAGVASVKAVELGFSKLGCASTGNLAAAISAQAARLALPCYIFMPCDTEPAKVSQAFAYGGNLVGVRGTYDDANRIAFSASDTYEIAIVNVNLRPYYTEGSKTLAFETAEQLGWKSPDFVIVPVASGAMFCSIQKGFSELLEASLINNFDTRFVAAQPAGCAPVSDAFNEGQERHTPVRNPKTVAKSLAIGDPGDGYYALKTLKRTNGLATSVTDEQILDSISLLAKTEGIFTEPAGGVTIASLRELVSRGVFEREDVVVCYITGNGLKTVDLIRSVSFTRVIEPRISELQKVFGKEPSKPIIVSAR